MKLYVIADDLTGANATSVLLAKEGFKCSTFIDSKLLNGDNMSKYDIVAISTDSRGITKEDAYKKVMEEVNRVKNLNPIYAKRIDSTLRGNIGSEIDAILDNDEDSIAIVVASYPDSGRISIGGFLLVNSVPLQKTLVARDPKCPVRNSNVNEIIESQTKYRVGKIEINDVLRGEDFLSRKINLLVDEGNRIIVIDAVTNDDIDIIAQASNMTNLNIIPVDPGPFTKSFMNEKYGASVVEQGKKVFFAIGSVSKTTIGQIEYLVANKGPALIKVDSLKLINDEEIDYEIERVTNIISEKLIEDKSNVIGISTTTREDEVLDLKELSKGLNLDEEAISVKINIGLAKITEKALEISKSSIGALYTSGGDVTMEVMKKLGVKGIDIKDEVIPLAVYGRFIGGKYPNMPAITKGGLIGDQKTLSLCIDYLLTKVSTQYYVK
ncbi:four-carbon acid sugar kinase family protein [Romboutsia ilealis]|uniref:Four-carbon acid sugar kinase family protein n=1 Tax=Romboutsia faecis TaxID=2764597 RepID=A0ABR7JL47_9FIRM|nr:four-carbon acid sugar kinase family protein [Romboutsia faecis]MBC5995423.1 four-carbon acid sugar kinase family protein [Romboutsia faecis]MRN24334.1 four-carbon acid sugar kinase family protein [Romboutsia ilealis]